MNDKAPPKPRKQPRQSRSQLLVRSIREACMKILDEEGPAQLTTQRIADVAGINIASLYRYFPNKEAVLAEVFEEHVQRYMEVVKRRSQDIQRLSEHSLEQALAAIIDMEVEQMLLLQRLDPEFYRSYRQSFDLHERGNEAARSLDNPTFEAWFPVMLRQHRAGLRSADIELMSHVARHALEGILQTAFKDMPGHFAIEDLKREIQVLLLRYLLAEPGRAEPGRAAPGRAEPENSEAQ